jgi:hypothetical protein
MELFTGQRSRNLCRLNFYPPPPPPPLSFQRRHSSCVKERELKQCEIKDNGEEYEEHDNDIKGGTRWRICKNGLPTDSSGSLSNVDQGNVVRSPQRGASLADMTASQIGIANRGLLTL